ncbi:MAG: hypothetical protein ACXWB2_20930, partial [Acidimicrobiales bacterium]
MTSSDTGTEVFGFVCFAFDDLPSFADLGDLPDRLELAEGSAAPLALPDPVAVAFFALMSWSLPTAPVIRQPTTRFRSGPRDDGYRPRMAHLRHHEATDHVITLTDGRRLGY